MSRSRRADARSTGGSARRVVGRGAAVLLLAGIAVGAVASPAWAHAVLLQTTPAPGQVLTTAPKTISLRFNESIEASLGAVRLFDNRGRRLDAGAPEKPSPDTVQVPLRATLHHGSYVVTWRVISADSHPVQGAFTFQVGTASNATSPQIRGLANRLLREQHSDSVVGLLYGATRGLVFAGLALLIGGAVFCALIWPPARARRRSAQVIWVGWWTATVATAAGLLLQGPYGAALPLADAFKPDVIGDVLDTRFGHIWFARLVLLGLAIPLLRVLLARPAGARPLPRWWMPSAGATAVALALTPGLAGHAVTGDLTALALPADGLHVLAMAVWLGGLVALSVAVLPRRDVDELRDAVPAFSRVAFACVAALVVTGVFQGWRQVGSLDALQHTDYGQMLLIKLFFFLPLVVVAARSRQIVNYLFPMPVDQPEKVPVATGGSDDRVDPALENEDWGIDEDDEIRRLRGSVLVEMVLAVAVIVVTALLVNAVPAKIAQGQLSGGATGVTLKSSILWIDVTTTPGKAGANDVHVSAITPDGAPVNPTDLKVSLSYPDRRIAPIDVPLRRLGPGHYLSPGFDIPIKGTWRVTAKATTGAFDEVTLTGDLTID